MHAPDIVEAILDGQQPPGLQLDDLLAPLPVEWPAQKLALFLFPSATADLAGPLTFRLFCSRSAYSTPTIDSGVARAYPL